MTISSTTSRISYTGNAATTAFSVPFRFDATSDLVVYLRSTAGVMTLQTYGTDYTLSGTGVDAGGTCTFTTAPASGTTVILYRDPQLVQTTDYSDNSAFPAATHEAALDKAVMINQRTRDLVTRAVRLPDGDTAIDMSLPATEVRASKFMAFDANGQPTASAGTLTGAAVSTTMQPVVEAATLATALVDLGLTAYTTGGTSTAYTVTTTQAFASLTALNGQSLLVKFNATNGASPTLNVDGLGAKAINGATTVAVETGALISGSVYRLTYINASNEFIVEGASSVATGFGLTGGTIARKGTISVSSSAPPSGFSAPINMSLSASVASNILTVAIKDAAGNDPSASSPVLIPFRSTTAGSGAVSWVAITSALSITTNATGATLGSSNNVPFRFWITTFNNGGTAVLALINCSTQSSTAVTIYPLNETGVASTTAISGSATSAGVHYTPNGTTLSSKAFRVIGWLEYSSGLATAGTYASAPSIVQLVGPGGRLPGQVVQTVYSTTTSTTAFSGNGVANKTALSLTGTITPTSAANPVRVSTLGIVGVNTAGAANDNPAVTQLYRGTGTTAIGNMSSGATVNGSNTGHHTSALFAFDSPQSSSSVQYGVYGWNSSGTDANTWLRSSVLGTNTGVMVLDEIMG